MCGFPGAFFVTTIYFYDHERRMMLVLYQRPILPSDRHVVTLGGVDREAIARELK